MRKILFYILINVCSINLTSGQAFDTICIRGTEYLLTLYGNSFFRYEDAKSLEITCGYLNPIDSIFYSCNGMAEFKVKNISQLQDGSGCCKKLDDDIIFHLDTINHIFFAKLHRFKYSKGLLILKKKGIGKISLYINDIAEKNRLDKVKTKENYIFILRNKMQH